MNDNDIKNFQNFLREQKVNGDNVEYTHTSFGQPWGKYFISDDKLCKFINLYKKALTYYINSGVDDIPLHITEKPKKVGPIVINLNFKINSKDRGYHNEHIEYIVGKFNNTIKEYVKTSDKNMEAFVFEKDSPTYVSKQNNYRDGMHIMYPHIAIHASLRYRIIELVQNEIKNEEKLTDIGFINSYEDIFNKGSVLKNGWLMYGSRKNNEDRYKLTHIYNDKCIETNHNIYSPDELVVLLDIRQYDPEDITPLREQYCNDNFNNEILNIYHKYHADPDKYNKKKKFMLINSSCDDTIDGLDNEIDKELQKSEYKPLWTDDENKQVLELVKQNKSIDEIAEIVKRTPKNVKYQLNRLAYEYHTRDKLSIDDVSVLVGLPLEDTREYVTKRWTYDSYNNNTFNVDEISKSTNTSKEDIYKYLTIIQKRLNKKNSKLNVNDDTIKSSIKMPIMVGKKWTEEENEKLLKEIQEKKSIDEIAELHQRMHGGVRSHLKELAYKFHCNDNKSIKEISELTGLPESDITLYFAKKENYQISKADRTTDATENENKPQKTNINKLENEQIITKLAEIESNINNLMENQNMILNMLKHNISYTNKITEEIPKQIQKKIMVKGRKSECDQEPIKSVNKISNSTDNKNKSLENSKQENDNKSVKNVHNLFVVM